MKQTCKVTIYHLREKEYVRAVYEGCFWDADAATAVEKTGLANADSLYVSIPLLNAPALTVAKGKDLIVQGECSVEIDNTSQTTQTASIKALKAEYDVYTITTLTRKDHGSPRMHHWEVGGK